KVLSDTGSPLSGVNVTFNINGVFYNRLTDANGVASLAINLEPGTYTITAEYDSGRVSNKITVKPVILTSDVTMYYKDGTTFKATILDGMGNVLPGVEVTFNINGVFYQRTTNSSGVANLNINLQSGKYIITSMYNGLGVSNTITIRNI
ncbi:MAG: peptidase C1, partial [Methanobrevibacter sp.]|nr:peptidase C1 [Methanobrevibacter sp.]